MAEKCELEDCCDDFDKVPTKDEGRPTYKFREKLPRSKNERRKLPGHACQDCEAYYAETGTANLSSRHRGPPRPKTPEHFWELDFPSHEECVKRGYIKDGGVYKPEEKKYYDKPIKRKAEP